MQSEMRPLTNWLMRKLYIAAALLSLLGLADALYLTVEHVTGQSVRCTIISGCSEVLSSPYAVLAGIPLAALALQRISLSSVWPHSLRLVIAPPGRC